MLRGKDKVTPVVDAAADDDEAETRPAAGTTGGASTAPAGTKKSKGKKETFNQRVVSTFRSQVLEGIGEDGRDENGNILTKNIYKQLRDLQTSSSSAPNSDPARLAAALCFVSTEAVPEAMSDDEATAYLERVLEEHDRKRCFRCLGGRVRAARSRSENRRSDVYTSERNRRYRSACTEGTDGGDCVGGGPSEPELAEF